MNLPRLLRTVRHLRPVQIYGRLLFELRPRRAPGAVPASVAPRPGTWQAPIASERSALPGERFRFLGEEHAIASERDWQRGDLEPLWLYNLHYFDDLRAADAPARRAEQRARLERWARENPPGVGIGWDSYPCSLRIVNWIKWVLAGGELGAALEANLALQAEYLSQHVEHHLQGNHLLANAKGLVFAGLYFTGEAAGRWLRAGVDLLERQLSEQILPDGGHCELSPMYHSLVLEDLLDLINLSRVSAAGAALAAQRRIEPRVPRMFDWLGCLTHPDGEIALFNDAALGIAPAPDGLRAYALRLGIEIERSPARAVAHLRDSGYVRLEAGPALLLADVGEVGPAHLTGHAHADTLSFELSLADRRVLVDSGTSRYGTGDERVRQRSTAAHNTLEIDGESSSEVWGGFRTGRRAHPFGLAIAQDAGALSLRCSHDGYRHRRGRPVHERSFHLSASGLEVVDRVHGPFGRACASFHVEPGVRAALEQDGSSGRLELPGGPRIGLAIRGGRARLEASTYHPRFGAALANQVLRVELAGPQCALRLDWS